MQFILRRISTRGVEMNFALGGKYTVVHKAEAPEEFHRDLRRHHGVYDGNPVDSVSALPVDESIYAFVGSEGGLDIYPLYINQSNYIMTDGGKTFHNLTVKP